MLKCHQFVYLIRFMRASRETEDGRTYYLMRQNGISPSTHFHPFSYSTVTSAARPLPQPFSSLFKIHANSIERPAGPPHLYAKPTISGASLAGLAIKKSVKKRRGDNASRIASQPLNTINLYISMLSGRN